MLHSAVRDENIDKVKDLIATGADVNEIDKHKRSPLHLACWKGNSDIAMLLLRSNATTSLKAMDNFSAVHFAAQNMNGSECINCIVKKDKSLLNARITKGNKSALHLAVSKGNTNVINCLIKLGADLSAKTTGGQLPIDFAKDENIKQILIDGIVAKKEANLKKFESNKDKIKDIEMNIESNERKIETEEIHSSNNSSNKRVIDVISVNNNVDNNVDNKDLAIKSNHVINEDIDTIIPVIIKKSKKKKSGGSIGISFAHLEED
jgi:ankyrin repeat protein